MLSWIECPRAKGLLTGGQVHMTDLCVRILHRFHGYFRQLLCRPHSWQRSHCKLQLFAVALYAGVLVHRAVFGRQRPSNLEDGYHIFQPLGVQRKGVVIGDESSEESRKVLVWPPPQYVCSCV